jgi:hypothetical protein
VDLTGWIQNQSLFEPLPIAYHPHWKCYRCNVCDAPYRSIENHFRAKHAGELAVSQRIFAAASETYPEGDISLILPTGLTLQSPYPEHIPGIPTSDGFSCNLCAFFTVVRRTMVRHLAAAHQRTGQKGHSWVPPLTECKDLQRFFTGTADHWFPSSPVAPSSLASLPAGPHSSIDLVGLIAAQSRDAAMARQAVPMETADVNLWLGELYSGFHHATEHIADRTELHSLAAMAEDCREGEDGLKLLRKHFSAWAEETVSLGMAHLDSHTRARLGSGRVDFDTG